MATRAKTAANRKVVPRSKPTVLPPTLTPDQLASEVKTKLRITDKKKPTVASFKTKEPTSSELLASLNTASASLSTIVKGKGTSDSGTVAHLEETIRTCRNALVGLRRLGIKPMDVERSASHVVAKLIALDNEAASSFLQDMKVRVEELCFEERNAASLQSDSLLNYATLRYPLSMPQDDTKLFIVSTYLCHSLSTLPIYVFSPGHITHAGFHTAKDPVGQDVALERSLSTVHTLDTFIRWALALQEALPTKSYNDCCMRAYSGITKFSAPYSASYPRTVLYLRTLGLLCLLLTTNDIVKSETFWGQSSKFLASSIQKSSSEGQSGIECVIRTCNIILQAVEKRPDATAFKCSPLFGTFCGQWIDCARKLNDHQELQSIADLLAAPNVRSGLSESQNGKMSGAILEDDRQHEILRVCALFVRAANFMENYASNPNEQQSWASSSFNDVSYALRHNQDLLCLPDDLPSTSDHEPSSKVKMNKTWKALETLRRAASKSLDVSGRVKDRSIQRTCRELLEDIIGVLEFAATKITSTDLLTPLLDSLLTLSRLKVDPLVPATHDECFELLSRTLLLPGLDLQQFATKKSNIAEVGAIDPATKLNYQRCVSAGFYNTGAALYQSGKYSAATRFLSVGCLVGSHALAQHQLLLAELASTDNKEFWLQLEHQIFQRWDLLGSCFVKTGERQQAYDAFMKAIRLFPINHFASIFNDTADPKKRMLESSSLTRQVALTVERVTFLAINELLLPADQVPLNHALHPNGTQECTPEMCLFISVILEKQLEVLEKSKWKPHVRAALQPVLSGLSVVYKQSQRPAQVARMMVKTMELMYSAPMEDNTATTEETMSGLTALHVSQGTVDELVGVQYAMGHLWMAMHLHRRRNAPDAIIRHAETALSLLQPLVKPSDVKGKAPAVPSRVAGKRGRAAATTSQSQRTVPAVAPSSKTKKAPKTSPVHNGNIIPRATDASPGNEPPLSSLDFSELVGLLVNVSTLLDLIGAMIPRIQILDLARVFSERQLPTLGETYVRASLDLTQEYLRLGRVHDASSINQKTLSLVSQTTMAGETGIVHQLHHAEMLAIAGNLIDSLTHYSTAIELATRLDQEEAGTSTAERVAMKVTKIEHAALAARVFSVVQQCRDNPSTCVEGLLQALRLWNRAARTLARLAPSQSTPSDDPFTSEAATSNEIATATESEKPHPSMPFGGKKGLDFTELRVAKGILDTTHALCHAYLARGSPKEADYYAQQASNLAESISADVFTARACLRRADIQLSSGHVDLTQDLLDKAHALLSHATTVDYTDAKRLYGVLSIAQGEDEDAREHFAQAAIALRELQESFQGLKGVKNSPSTATSAEPTSPQDMVPGLLAAILRRHVWLVREDADEEYETVLERLSELPESTEIQAELHSIIAKLNLDEAFNNCKSDMFLSSLAESTIAMPSGITTDKPPALSPAIQEVLGILSNAEQLFLSDLQLLARRGRVSHVRDAAVSLAVITALRSSLGAPNPGAPTLAAKLLDVSASIAATRELLDSITMKHPDVKSVDDMRWPRMSDTGEPLRTEPSSNHQKRQKIRRMRMDSDEEESDVEDDTINKEYWARVRARHDRHTFTEEDASVSSGEVDRLPDHWSIVHLCMTEDKNTIIASRQRANEEPLVFCLPLKDRRETEEDEQLGFQDAVAELADIIKSSDECTRSVKTMDKDNKDVRAAWWAERAALDTRMKEFVENIEFCWLGGFKTILSRPSMATEEDIENLRQRFETIFHRCLHLRDKKVKNSVRLESGLVRCFSTLPPKSKDEELEDLVYFVLDLYQASGVHVVLSEVDVDQAVIELRSALEDHATKVVPKKGTKDDTHMFLVLDKNLQAIPWESTPILRGRSVSRIPNLSFLLDRVDLAQHQQKVAEDAKVDRLIVNPKETFYMLNPSGDLKGTETRFKPWVESMKAVGWSGIIGRVPSEQEFLDALQRKELVVYFGHGGGEQYVRSHKIRHLPRCAATMLWGCSSGLLRDMGEFDRTGTPYNYMLAGCPTLVANLWDITDRDIDKFTQSVIDQLSLTPEGVKGWEGRKRKTSVVTAVAKARAVCKLQYLTGAAPVVYGIPFYL